MLHWPVKPYMEDAAEAHTLQMIIITDNKTFKVDTVGTVGDHNAMSKGLGYFKMAW